MFLQHHHEHLGVDDRAGVKQFHEEKLTRMEHDPSSHFERNPTTRFLDYKFYISRMHHMIVNRSIIGNVLLITLLIVSTNLIKAAEDISLPNNSSNPSSVQTNQGPKEKNGNNDGWGFAEIMLVLGCFGAFGGGLAALSQVTFGEVIKKGIEAYGSGKKLAGIISVGMLLGCGGSFAFGFVLAVDRKFSGGIFDLDCKVLIAAASVAAGFSGIRLLKLVSDKLTKQVEEQGANLTAQKKEIEQQQTILQQQQTELQNQKIKLEQERQINEALSFAGGISGKESEEDRSLDGYRRDAVKLLETARKFDPTNRAIGVYLGRMYRLLKDYPKAIKELDESLERRRAQKIPLEKDDGTLIYNKACYTNLIARSKSGNEKINMQTEAQKLLKEAQSLDSDLVSYAKDDPDWK